MTDDWFENLFGFAEQSYGETQRQFDVVGTTLRSRIVNLRYAVVLGRRRSTVTL
jgi:hypothetical protein